MSDYVLGHEERELERLSLQAAMYRPLTDALIRRAGIGPGMRVLDIGCGAGDVALLVAEHGARVIGIDRSEEAVAWASRRAEGRASFEVAALADYAGEPFDAVIGRCVLLHQPDPAAALAQAIAHVRPGGIVVFQELELAARGTTHPRLPLFDRIWDWILPACERAGVATHMGLALAPMFARAGLVDVGAVMDGAVGFGPDALAYAYAAETVRSLLPAIEQLGIATAAEIDLDTLAARLRDEALAANAAMVSAIMVGAWGRKP
jgi:SAM-dependent methyltransferase